jgi:hypothetical protein
MAGNPNPNLATRFKKGVSGNPKGLNPVSPQIKLIKSRALEDYNEWYEILREKALIDQKSWAMKMFRDHLPKHIRESQKTVKIVQDTSSTEAQITSIRKGLAEFEEHDMDSAATLLKALSANKIAETTAQLEADVIEDRKELLKKIDLVLEIADEKTEEEKGKFEIDET